MTMDLDEIWKSLSQPYKAPNDREEKVRLKERARSVSSATTTTTTTTFSSCMHTSDKHQQHVLSPASSTSSRHSSKSTVVQALAAAQRRNRMASPPSSVGDDGSMHSSSRSGTSDLNIPSLQESRNDLERRHLESMVHVKSEDGELELLLKPNYASEEEEKKCGSVESSPVSLDSMSPRFSPSTLERRTQEIIFEAQMASSQLGSSSSYQSIPDDPRSRDLIRQALDVAAARHKARAAISAAKSRNAASGTLTPPVADTSDSFSNTKLEGRAQGLKLRSTQDVLDFANAKMGLTPRNSPGQSPLRDDFHPSQNSRSPISRLSDDYATTTPTSKPSTPHQTFQKYLSPSESLGSIDDYEKAVKRLPSRLTESEKLPREKILQRIDGYATPPVGVSPATTHPALSSNLENEETSVMSGSKLSVATKTTKEIKPVVVKSLVTKGEGEGDVKGDSSFGGWLNSLWNGSQDDQQVVEHFGSSGGPVPYGPRRVTVDDGMPAMATSLVKVTSSPDAPAYSEAVNAKKIDPRMPEWIGNQFSVPKEMPRSDGTYHLGESRTVIVHEILRGHWTWCTAWAPDGDRLAVATDNHHLAVIDTKSSAIWRVKHDRKVITPPKQGTTHSIRCISWGVQFIAIGGVGNAVSILAPSEPYPILHLITPTGFVGSLDWLTGSNTIIIGSRLGKAMIVKIWAQDQDIADSPSLPAFKSTILHTIDRGRAWVNAVKFSPGGKAFAVGDSKGILGVYSYEEKPGAPVTVVNLANFKLEDSILDIEWSPDGQWLYAGGEDFVVTVISTEWWEAVHRIKRDRWVQFISSSRGGSHVAIGGVSSEVSILDVKRGWETAINLSLKGIVPLSAQWHPQDQYLVLTGQDNSILAVETTNARYVSGHFLRSVSPILAIQFSADGRMAVIGNEAGVVTIFKLSGTSFITAYEMVLDCNGSLSIEWSWNGAFVAIAAGNKLIIVSHTTSGSGRTNAPPGGSGFSVATIIRDIGLVNDVSIDPQSRFVAVSGSRTRIYDATSDFMCVIEMEDCGITMANSWSPDGTWLAIIGRNENLTIYDTSSQDLMKWHPIFTVQTKQSGLALAWGPAVPGGLQYCAYGGEDKEVYIMEIRNKERTWETVLAIPRDGVIHDLDWNSEGLLAAAIGDGTVTVIDLSYLQSGWPVNEMDYNWQRQALTCFTEIRRNRGKNCMRCVRWIPSAPGSDSLLAVGGTDGELEIVDLTERQKCSGFSKVSPSI